MPVWKIENLPRGINGSFTLLKSLTLFGVESHQYVPLCQIAFKCKSSSLLTSEKQSLDRDWIDHALPQAHDELDWFPFQCQYASVISSAAKMLYSQNALHQTLGEREQVLEIAYNLLEDWRSRLPTLFREIYKPNIHRILDDEHLRYIALPMF
jgi:hypothetical protein